MNKLILRWILIGSSIFTYTAVIAGDLTGGGTQATGDMNSFGAGNAAIAADVNYNFDRVKDEVNDNNARINTNASGITTNSGNITGNATNISTNSSNISTNQTNIGNNASGISTNSTAISTNSTSIGTKQNRVSAFCSAGSSIRAIDASGGVTCEVDSNSGGDVTGVIAGSGLTGTGYSGNVTLSIPASGVTSTHILNSTITGSDIASNTVQSADVSNLYDIDIVDEPGLDYHEGGLTYTSSIATCNTYTPLASVSISAPTAGYILVHAPGRAYKTTETGYYYLRLGESGTDGGTSGQNWDYFSGSTTAIQYEGFSFQHVYPVSAGTHTYYLKSCRSDTTVSGYVYTHTMVATFFPTRY